MSYHWLDWNQQILCRLVKKREEGNLTAIMWARTSSTARSTSEAITIR
jgi:hypothetical protein